MEGSFFGSGWAFPVGVEESKGKIEMSRDEKDVREAIEIIISTAKGERVMRTDFGCGIYEYVFSVINSTTIGLIESCVMDALLTWEPRITVNSVKVSTGNMGEGRLDINIDYTIRVTNSRQNMVYPFYIQGR